LAKRRSKRKNSKENIEKEKCFNHQRIIHKVKENSSEVKNNISFKNNMVVPTFQSHGSPITFTIPCVNSRRKGCSGTCLRAILISILIVTVIFNVIFIMDHRRRFTENSNRVNNDENKHIKFERNDDSQRSNNIIKKQVSTGRIIKVEAKSSKENVYVSINGLKVYENSGIDDAGRGIHVVVINEQNGIVMAKRVFDTYVPREDEAMILFLNMLQDGRIVVFMVKDEGSASLKKSGKTSINMFGSRFINSIGWRDTWAFISKKRNTWLAEAHQKPPSPELWGPPLIVQTSIQLEEKEKKCYWGNDDSARRRKQFCMKYEGYGSVCSCTNPAPINLRGGDLLGSRVSSLPIAVIAANRPHYLYRMLRGLLTTPGVDPKMVTVYIDGFYDEPSAVAELFEVATVEHTPICSKNCRISQHYKRTLHETFEKYKSADYMIILEEDLDVSKDLMDYFSQMLPVLGTDDSLYCVSAWNDQGYEHSCNDASMLYRVETMPGLGWVLKKKLFLEELEPNWPGSDKFWDWDMWMRMQANRKGRECIIPDISRTYHFGAKGLNMNAFFQDLYFTKHALNTQTGVKFDTSKVTKDGYEVEVHKLLKEAELLDHTKNPCVGEDFIPNVKSKTFVLYIKQNEDGDYETWTNLAKCFKLWDLDVRGFHKQMWRFWLKGNHIFIIGTSSPYASYKPDHIIPIYLPKKKKENEE